MIIIGFVVVVVQSCCTYGVFVCIMFGLRLICCSGSSNGFCIVCFEAHRQTFESCHLTKKYLYGL